jgi:hypothetical protein
MIRENKNKRKRLMGRDPEEHRRASEVCAASGGI